MRLSRDLLDAASETVRGLPATSGQAALRRAVSTAYYAVFHLLVEEACAALARGRDLREMRVALARGFEHRTMRVVSEAFGALVPTVAALCPRGVPARLQSVADSVVELQAARMDADYLHGKRWRAAWARNHVELAESAFVAWEEVRSHQAARVYLLALQSGLPRSR